MKTSGKRAIQLAIVTMDGSWRIYLNGEGLGRFARRADATLCALDIAGETRLEGYPVEVLLQDDFGEVRTLAPPGGAAA